LAPSGIEVLNDAGRRQTFPQGRIPTELNSIPEGTERRSGPKVNTIGAKRPLPDFSANHSTSSRPYVSALTQQTVTGARTALRIAVHQHFGFSQDLRSVSQIFITGRFSLTWLAP
jgi:hypothetical protein